jgi:transposase-like protein
MGMKERIIGVHLWRWTPMQETDSEFHLVVTGMRRDGRRRYDDDSKLALVKACLQPGVSLAGMALKHGVNANLLRKWVVSHQLAVGAQTRPAANRMDAFIPVMLGNGSATRSAQNKPVPGRLAAVGAIAGANAQRRHVRV